MEELVPGVWLVNDTVRIILDDQEIAVWTIDGDIAKYQEMIEAVALAAKEGAYAVKDNITSNGERLREMLEETRLGMN